MAGLTFNIDPAGRLLIMPTRRKVALRLTESSADVLYPGVAPVALSWDDYGARRELVDGPVRDGWQITTYAPGRPTRHGVAIRVSGAYDVASHDMIRVVGTFGYRFGFRHGGTVIGGHYIAFLPGVFLAPHRPERATLAALATILSRRPGLRSALSSSKRTARLAQDLSSGMLPDPPTRTGFARDSVDILIAMHSLGVYHRFGRPLPGEPLPTLNELVPLIHSRLGANPYWNNRLIDDDRIARLAQSHYLDVRPWPFGALFS